MAFKNKFDGGELDKWTLGAVDDPVYQRGCAWLENFQLLENGGINRRAGYKHIAKILEGTGDRSVRLVPLVIDDHTQIIEFVSKSAYGFLEFTDYQFARKVEKTVSPSAFKYTVDFYARDPDSAYSITSIKTFIAPYIIQKDDTGVSAYDKQISAAQIKITDAVAETQGDLKTVSDSFIKAGPKLYTGAVSGGEVNDFPFFNEHGTGNTAEVTFRAQIEYQFYRYHLLFGVTSGGSGYSAGDVIQVNAGAFGTLSLRVVEVDGGTIRALDLKQGAVVEDATRALDYRREQVRPETGLRRVDDNAGLPVLAVSDVPIIDYPDPVSSGNCSSITTITGSGSGLALDYVTDEREHYARFILAFTVKSGGKFYANRPGGIPLNLKLPDPKDADGAVIGKGVDITVSGVADANGVLSAIVPYRIDLPYVSYKQSTDYTPSTPKVLVGGKASFDVRSSYNHTSETVVFKVHLEEGGNGYFRSPNGKQAIVMHLMPKNAASDYWYDFEIPASSVGQNNALKIPEQPDPDDPERECYIVTLPAKYTTPPHNGDGLLTSKKTNETQSVYIESVNNSGGNNVVDEGWDVYITAPHSKYETGILDADAKRFTLNEALTLSFFIGDDLYTIGQSVAATELVSNKICTAEIIDGGKLQISGIAALPFDFNGIEPLSLDITTAFRGGGSVLLDEPAPDEGSIYRVLADEHKNGDTTYWQNVNGSWQQVIDAALPKTDDAVDKLQYVYNGALTAFAGEGLKPFILRLDKVDGVYDISMTAFSITRSITNDITAPEAFKETYTPINTEYDEAVPVRFCDDPDDCPSVIYYDNGRWWFASTVNEPERIWVSKPVKKAVTDLDFSTYINFLTIGYELHTFQGKNELGQAAIIETSEGAETYASRMLNNELKDKDISFGIVPAEIVKTIFFKDGGKIIAINNGNMTISGKSTPHKDYYTESAFNKMRSAAAYNTAVARLRYVYPGGLSVVESNVDSFSIRTVNIDGFQAGLTFSTGTAHIELAVADTGWGTSAETGKAILGATAAGGIAGGLFGLSNLATLPGILALANSRRKDVIEKCWNNVSLLTTDGTKRAPGRKDVIPTANDWGDLQSESIMAKADFLVATYKLYETKQPFSLSIYTLKETHYSTVGCGFTFTMSSDEKESVNLITNNRSFFVSTSASERSMPATVNGETQAAQTGSFFGSEKVQPAKAADAVYFVQKGGQRIMRSFWQPNVSVPTIADVQKYNREILRGRRVVNMASTRTIPVSVWCILDDGTCAVLVDAAGRGHAAWSRVTSYAGDIVATAALSANGMAALRINAIYRDGTIDMVGIPERQSEPDDIFLDNWAVFDTDISYRYGADAVIYDRGTGRVYSISSPPPPSADCIIGYPYMSKMRTLPADTAQGMKPARVARARFRFLESAMPYIKGYPTGQENKIITPDPRRVIDGIADIPVPGNVELDAAFEVYTKEPEPLSIIALITEED